MRKIKLTPQASFLLAQRFLRTDKQNEPIESPAQMFQRVSDKVASADLYYGATLKIAEQLAQNFYDELADLRFLPNSPILHNVGRKLPILSACFVLPIEDSLESIYETLKNAALIHRCGAACGYDFSSLRPKGTLVSTTGKPSTGPISFMHLFDFSSETILNVASPRHAGQMGVLRIDHPDIEEFIAAKRDPYQLTNFNISVAITDAFMEAVKADKYFNLIHPQSELPVKKIKAARLFAQLAENTHRSGEPGVIYIDEINRRNQLPGVGLIRAVNQCGEQPLFPYEACTLGSLNLVKFLDPRQHSGYGKVGRMINWKKLERSIEMAVHFLDNTIDLNQYPVKESYEINHANRRIGLGVMGWADLLYRLRIPYNSLVALQLAEEVMRFINQKAAQSSMLLGEQRGNFPNFERSIYYGKVKFMRNCARTTIAPTGHLSLIAGVNGGIEPFFSLAYVRKKMETLSNQEMGFVNEIFIEEAKRQGFYKPGLKGQIIQTGSVKDLDQVPLETKKIFVTALDISFRDHILMQAAFQKHVENGVSKTINLPEEATLDDVKASFWLAYQSKCKGVAIYRNKSRAEQVLNVGDT